MKICIEKRIKKCEIQKTIDRKISLLMVAILIPVALLLSAWGPDRNTYDLDDDTSELVTFNSIVDATISDIMDNAWKSTFIEDERQFMNIKEDGLMQSWKSSESNSSDDNKIRVEKGKTYRIRIWVHNIDESPSATATNTRAFVVVSSTDPDTRKSIYTFIEANNATPQSIWDECELVADRPFYIVCIPGSAEYSNNWTNGSNLMSDFEQIKPDFEHEGYAPLSDKLFTADGVKLGYDNYDYKMREFDGIFLGGYKYSGEIFFDIKPQFVEEDTIISNDIINTSIQEYGGDAWVNVLDLEEGSLVCVKVEFENIANQEMQNVAIRTKLESGLSYVENTLSFTNSKFHNQQIKGDPTMLGGIDIGAYSPGETALLEFIVKIDKNVSSQVLSIVNEAKLMSDEKVQIEDSVAMIKIDKVKGNAETNYYENYINISGDNLGSVQNGNGTNAIVNEPNSGFEIIGIIVTLIGIVATTVGIVRRKQIVVFIKGSKAHLPASAEVSIDSDTEDACERSDQVCAKPPVP